MNRAIIPWRRGYINYGTCCWEFWKRHLFVIPLGTGEGRWERGQGENRGQRAGRGGVDGTVGLKSSLTVVPLLDLVILDHMFFKSGVNSSLVQKIYFPFRVG